MIISKVIRNSVSPIRKICFIFLGTLCSFQGKNDNKLLDTECYHLISLSTYIYLTKKTYEPLSLRVVPISENLASGPRTTSNLFARRAEQWRRLCLLIRVMTSLEMRWPVLLCTGWRNRIVDNYLDCSFLWCRYWSLRHVTFDDRSLCSNGGTCFDPLHTYQRQQKLL